MTEDKIVIKFDLDEIVKIVKDEFTFNDEIAREVALSTIRGEARSMYWYERLYSSIVWHTQKLLGFTNTCAECNAIWADNLIFGDFRMFSITCFNKRCPNRRL